MSPVVERAQGYWTCDGEIRHADDFDDGVPDYWEPVTHCGWCYREMDDNESSFHAGCVDVARAHGQIEQARLDALVEEGR